MVFVSKYLVAKGYNGLTIFPFVFLKSDRFKTDSVLINHERIHLRQQMEMLVIPFYLVYGFEFLVRLFQCQTWHLAYKNVSFEREAYCYEENMEYLKSRPFWGFLKYLRVDDF